MKPSISVSLFMFQNSFFEKFRGYGTSKRNFPSEIYLFGGICKNAQNGDEEVEELLTPLLEKPLEEEMLHISMDKAWEPIHRCLTRDYTPGWEVDFDAGTRPLKLCVLGGEPLLFHHGYRTAMLLQPEEVVEVAVELGKIDKEWLRKEFFKIPDGQFHEINEEAFEWMWAHFEDLPAFFAEAAEARIAVICTISH